MTVSRASLRVFTAFTLFTVLAGDVWRNLLSWWAFGAIALVIGGFSVALLARGPNRLRIRSLPYPLLAFVVLATASLVWSYYPSGTALGLFSSLLTIVGGLAIALNVSRAELLRSLSLVLRLILGLSLVFELFVSLVVRRPVLPFWTDYGNGELPKLLFWSRDLLLEGGKIQGIVGSSALLSFVAVLGVVVFGIQLADGSIRRVMAASWLVVGGGCVLLTRSATMTLAMVALIAVTGAVLLLRRARTPRARTAVYLSLTGLLALGASAAFFFSSQLLGLLGKSDDLTGRLGIWEKVIDLAQQRPVLGWGWISYWAPWLPPFDSLVFHAGIRQLHAHNAWLDIWLQLGVLGLVVFGLLVLGALLRSWAGAVDRPELGHGLRGRFTAESLLPLLILVALLVQSAAESRLIIEYGLLLLVVVAVSTKLPPVPTLDEAPLAATRRDAGMP